MPTSLVEHLHCQLRRQLESAIEIIKVLGPEAAETHRSAIETMAALLSDSHEAHQEANSLVGGPSLAQDADTEAGHSSVSAETRLQLEAVSINPELIRHIKRIRPCLFRLQQSKGRAV